MFLFSIVLFFVLLSSLYKSWGRIKLGNELIAKNEEIINKLQEENKKLEEQAEFMQSEIFIERQLRNKLGLAKEGEVILILPEAEIVKKLSPQIPKKEPVRPKTNFEKWLKLFEN